jgi:hypothetical protein
VVGEHTPRNSGKAGAPGRAEFHYPRVPPAIDQIPDAQRGFRFETAQAKRRMKK